MSCKLILGPSFPALLEELLEELQGHCRNHPLSPQWVVVPSSTLANHLRESLSQQAKDRPLPSVRVIPILGFIRRLCSLMKGFQGSRRWNPSMDLILFQLVEQLPSSSSLARLKRLAGGFRFLRPTFLDLADGGFGPEQMEILEALLNEAYLLGPEQDTLELYRRWVQTVVELEIPWEPLVHQQVSEWTLQEQESTLFSCMGCESGQVPVVTVFGFYGFTDVNAQIISSLARRVDLRLFYPGWDGGEGGHPAFFFTKALLEDLQLRIGTALEETVQLQVPDSGTASHFFLSTFPEGEISALPGFLTFQQASGVRAEVVSAALKIREWLDDPAQSIPPERILFVAPDPAPYLDAVREIFSAFGIPYRLADVPTGTTPEAETLRILARIWESRASAEWILAYFRDHPGIPLLKEIDIQGFEAKVRRLGIWGDKSWGSALEMNQVDANSGKSHLPNFTQLEKGLIQEIVDQWVLEDFDGLLPARALVLMQKLQQTWLEDPGVLTPAIEALRMAEQSLPKIKLAESFLQEMLRPGEESTQTESMNTHGVLVLSAMRARGFSVEGMVLVGLSSNRWPARIQEDPLLSDISRGHLMARAQDVGHLLPIKSHMTEEMTLLFQLLNSSSQRIHWVVPETDETGRTVAPTPWVQRYLQHWPKTDRTGPGRVPRGPSQQAETLLTLDPERGSLLPPHLLLLLEPGVAPHFQDDIPYGYLLEGLNKRKRDPHWNGHIPEAALPRPHKDSERVRVTDLEQLARCPFRYYAGGLAGWTALETLEMTDQLSSLDWGSLVHGFLERLLLEGANRKETLGTIAQSLLESEAIKLQQALTEFSDGLHSRLQLLPEPFREATLTRLLELAHGWLAEVLKGKRGQSAPVALEVKRRVPFPGVPDLSISGQIDRIDRLEESVHITDYKSGRSPSRSQLRKEIRLGHRLQPTLYPWLHSQDSANTPRASFSYLFLGHAPPQDQEALGVEDVARFLGPLAEILQQGLYLPTSKETLELHGIEGTHPCQYCEYTSVCRKLDPGASQHLYQISKEKLGARMDDMLEGSTSNHPS